MGTSLSGAQWLNLLINLLLPILVALVTQRFAAGSVKAITLLLLSALSGFLVSWLDAVNDGSIFNWSQAGFTMLTGFITAVAFHYGLLKPANITGSTGAVASAVPAGLGTPVPHTHASVAETASRRAA
jgi:hypothetical protein